MKKTDFFNDTIIAFSTGKHHHAHLHIYAEVSLRVVYYEWSKSSNKWMKLRDADPEPDHSTLPTGKFDGQIIEVEL